MNTKQLTQEAWEVRDLLEQLFVNLQNGYPNVPHSNAMTAASATKSTLTAALTTVKTSADSSWQTIFSIIEQYFSLYAGYAIDEYGSDAERIAAMMTCLILFEEVESLYKDSIAGADGLQKNLHQIAADHKFSTTHVRLVNSANNVLKRYGLGDGNSGVQR